MGANEGEGEKGEKKEREGLESKILLIIYSNMAEKRLK